MPAGLTIKAAWEKLNEGSSEEIASFGLMEIGANGLLLTEGTDTFVDRLRPGPLVSNYHCAEWLAWNWWRLRWEPRTGAGDWALSHKMSTIGHGYVWPNVTIYSDGERIVLQAKPSSDKRETAFRYICNGAAVIRAVEFEGAVVEYINQVLTQIRAEKIEASDLERLWQELQEEVRNPDIAARRRLEALMGREPDEGDEETIDGLIADANDLGVDATREIAAHSGMSGHLRRAGDLRDTAARVGIETRPADAAVLAPNADLPAIGHSPAWKRGTAAAQALREQERLGQGPIDNHRLEALAGVRHGAVANRDNRDDDLAFVLDDGPNSRMVFRSKWDTGRRFELARLLGDHAAMRAEERLRPATRAYTYRQQLQRAFAAEFLCPFDALYQMLQRDYSAEALEDAGHHFQVSEMTIRSLLVNHRCLDRAELEAEIDMAEPQVAA